MLADFAKIVKVPQTRFYSAIDCNDGTTEGQEKGGYKKATAGKNLNFEIVHPTAVIQANKLVKPKIITPENNQNSDAWKYGYRLVSYAKVYENKAAGVYAHIAAK